jgi:[ribosomal protein S18]-alanine N-acetyltransferase
MQRKFEFAGKQARTSRPHLRWMLRRDRAEVLDIERSVFFDPWRDDDFTAALRERNVIGKVAEGGERVLGFSVYKCHPRSIEILNLAVDPNHHRRGIGAALVGGLVGRERCGRRRTLRALVREYNLDAQLFFRSMGFHCTGILHGFHRALGEDAYRFTYRLGSRGSRVES